MLSWQEFNLHCELMQDAFAAWTPRGGLEVDMYFQSLDVYCKFSRPMTLPKACDRFRLLASSIAPSQVPMTGQQRHHLQQERTPRRCTHALLARMA